MTSSLGPEMPRSPPARIWRQHASLGLLAVFTTAGGFAATVVRGPYLQAATQESVVVRWRTDTPAKSVVRFGLRADRLDQMVEDDKELSDHIIKIAGLKPDTRYYYSVGDGTHLTGGPDFSVASLPVAGRPRPVRFWVLGDPGTGDARAKAVRDAYGKFTAGKTTDFIVLLGDNAYPDGTDAEYQQGFFDVYPEMLRRAVLWPALGNHDSHSAQSATQSGPYFDNFTVPTAGESGGMPSGTKAYYSFDFANVHFVSLDTSDSNRAPDGPMLRWLKADLAATKQEWIIPFFHHPPYTKGNHDSDAAKNNHDLFEVREQILPVLEAAGVDLIIAGHSHSYERSWLIDGHYGVSSTFEAAKYIKQAGLGQPAKDGPYHKSSARTPHEGEVIVVAGSSGKVTPAKLAPLNHPAMAVSVRETGSLMVEVDGDKLEVTFLNGEGQVRDSFRMEKK